MFYLCVLPVLCRWYSVFHSYDLSHVKIFPLVIKFSNMACINYLSCIKTICVNFTNPYTAYQRCPQRNNILVRQKPKTFSVSEMNNSSTLLQLLSFAPVSACHDLPGFGLLTLMLLFCCNEKKYQLWQMLDYWFS